MTWVSHVGRKSGQVAARPDAVRSLIADVRRAGLFVSGHLDLAASQLDRDPPIWALEPLGVAGVAARPAVAVHIDEAPTGLLLRSEQVTGFDPTRLTADLDLIDEPGGCLLVARWDAAVDLPVPRLARRPAGQIVGRIVSRLLDELLEQIRVATA